MFENLKQDNIFNGILFGIVCMIISYFSVLFLNKLFVYFFGKDYLIVPKLQLIVLTVNIIVFRFVMLTYKRYETGKGMLMVIAFVTILYVITYRTLIR